MDSLRCIEDAAASDLCVVVEEKQKEAGDDEKETIQMKKSKNKKSVRFSQVELYSFQRTQGFLSIPSDDGPSAITLGMSLTHDDSLTFESVDEFSKYKRGCHLQQLERQVEKSMLNSSQTATASVGALTDHNASLDGDELSKLVDVLEHRSHYENSAVDLGVNPDLFCPILTASEREQKLLESGFPPDQIDSDESREIAVIKESRLVCGCRCKEQNMMCSEAGNLCSCFMNGINCQLDKTKYPCSCTLKRCRNPYGIKRFDQRAVMRHYVQVLSDQKAEQQDRSDNAVGSQTSDQRAQQAHSPKKSGKKRRKKSSTFSTSKRKKTTAAISKTRTSLMDLDSAATLLCDGLAASTTTLDSSNQHDTVNEGTKIGPEIDHSHSPHHI